MNNIYKEIVPYLLDWFDYNARILPWREQPIPYFVWVSEIMLQQTRVEAVKGYFDRFITALPDIKALAEADEDKLLKLWEGLGYYNRVRNMQKAAQIIMKDYDGALPADYDKLLLLPGIGTYTAGAIASIAYDIPVPVVDGNVLRVAKRITASYDDITKGSVKKELWKELYDIMPKDRPGDFNQSLMELGATVCIPNGKPFCDKCPVVHLCRAFHQDVIMQLPVKPPKKERKQEERTILLIEYQGKYAIKKRAAKGLLAGLWELPGIDEKVDYKKLSKELKDGGLTIEAIKSIGEAKHIFSHVEWHMIGYHVKTGQVPAEYTKANSLLWVNRKDMETLYALPSAFSRYISYLRNI
ncbi:A/G-specific adenine glycosylase [Mobilitalea sibirica]|uniref:Adenine DNA glycosylase n=1 Tax=Mobilitalea sibirica TaxID=1462919 RepID=A0A8J7HBI8_9FIRM|nr:A/G-specific adenine glycosylase [Mobilitalea sibirica]MBH1940042.1 A/G-specific adenine glycosylase [Mobilitalea sibirica]